MPGAGCGGLSVLSTLRIMDACNASISLTLDMTSVWLRALSELQEYSCVGDGSRG